jgi:hypothetical protein
MRIESVVLSYKRSGISIAIGTALPAYFPMQNLVPCLRQHPSQNLQELYVQYMIGHTEQSGECKNTSDNL